MMEEFRYEYAQTQPKFAIVSIRTEWATFRAIFCLNKVEKIRVTWHNKGQANVATTDDWDKIKRQLAKQPNSKINGNFPWRLVIEIQEQQSRQ